MRHRNWPCEKRVIEDNIHALKRGEDVYFSGCKYSMGRCGEVFKERRDRTSEDLIAVVRDGVVVQMKTL